MFFFLGGVIFVPSRFRACSSAIQATQTAVFAHFRCGRCAPQSGSEDRMQTFFPLGSVFGDDADAVDGPADGGHEIAWVIRGDPGDVVHIEFQRVYTEKDERKISWRKVSSDTVFPVLEHGVWFAVGGSWDGFSLSSVHLDIPLETWIRQTEHSSCNMDMPELRRLTQIFANVVEMFFLVQVVRRG